LARVGGHECGLDFEKNGACQMDVDGREVNYFCCPRVLSVKCGLEVAAHKIWFRNYAGVATSLANWIDNPRSRRHY